MKFFFITILFLSLLSHAQELQHFNENSLKELEKQMLDFYKKRNLSPQELQGKYFQAANYLEGKNKRSLAIVLLEKGLSLENPTLEYLHFLSLLYEVTDATDKIQNIFLEYLKKNKYSSHEDDLFIDIIRILSLKKNILPDEYITFKIKSAEARAQLTWIESIVLTKKKDYKKAYSILERIELLSPEDKIYISFLQKMNEKAPVFCLNISSMSEFLQSFEEACHLIVSQSPKNLINKLKEIRSINRNTPLYEVLN